MHEAGGSDGMGALGEVRPLGQLSMTPAPSMRPACALHSCYTTGPCPGTLALKLGAGAGRREVAGRR